MDFKSQPAKVKEEAVRHLFDRSVSSHSNLFVDERSGKNYSFRKRLALAAEMSATGSGHLLDCGVGTGDITLAMLKAGTFSRATLVDLSADMLHHAELLLKSQYPEIQLEFANRSIFEYLQLDGRKNRYDFISCLGVIAHTGRLPELLTLFREVLSENGCILLQGSLAEHWGTRVNRLVTKALGNPHGYPLHYFTTQEILSAANHAGLQLVRATRYSVGLPSADRLWQRGNYWIERLSDRWSVGNGAEGLFLLKSKSF